MSAPHQSQTGQRRRILLNAAVLAAAILTRPAIGQKTLSSYAGADRCTACHRAQAIVQVLSAHALALSPAAEHPLAKSFSAGHNLTRLGIYEYSFQAEPALRMSIHDSKDKMIIPLEWAFGAGRQAVTFVTRVDREWYVEYSASYYTATKRYGLTPGHDRIKPSSLAEAAGVLYKIGDDARGIEACFECHSTGLVSFDSEGQAKITEKGVRCEACHGGATKHVSDPKSNPMPVLRGMPGSAMNELCGRCHRPPAGKRDTIDWNYAWNVRHQPVYLNESRCFQKSAGALSCVSCHNPHEQRAGKSMASYNRVCQSCHTQTVRKPNASCFTENQGNCVDCHMPLVSPQPALRFTNHWIGRYADGSRLRPVR